MSKLLKGAEVAAAICEKLVGRVETLKSHDITPTLAMIRIGARPDDIFYENAAVKRLEKVGATTVLHTLPIDITQAELLEIIQIINNDKNIHGVLILRPLPAHINDAVVRNALSPKKDVDGITDTSLSGIFVGVNTGFAPCTAQACIDMLDHFGYEVSGKHAVVVGRSLVVGKPLSMMLLNRNASVTVCHSYTKDIASVCRSADIIFSAAGKIGVITKNHVSPGQIIIDIGINVDTDGNMCGDVTEREVLPIVDALTAVPGGVGSVTTSVLAKHVVMAAERTL